MSDVASTNKIQATHQHFENKTDSLWSMEFKYQVAQKWVQ